MAKGPSTVPNSIDSARKRVCNSDFYALCYLMLSNLAYADEDDASAAVAQIETSLPQMPTPSDAFQGRWNLGWGPKASGDNSNLMYCAELVDSGSGVPVFSAVVIRGTDTQAKPSGILKQVIEDADAAHQVTFPAGNTSGAKIAQGTQVGLDTLTRFTDASRRTVEQYLDDFVTTNPAAPVVITGHSLGGCQTTVTAPYLSSKLPPETKIVPNTFAAPTAGNAAFVQLYEGMFAFCPRWFNILDLVPMAFAGLNEIKQLWRQCNRPAPEAFKLVLDGYQVLLRGLGVSYSQQSSGRSRQLPGSCQPASASLASKAPMDQVAGEIEESIRRVAAQVHVPVPEALFHGLTDWVKELLFQHLILTGYWNAVKSFPGVAPIPNPFEKTVAAAGN